MKNLRKSVRFSLVGAVIAAAFTLGLSPVFAGSPGQLAQGNNLYEVKNLTLSGSYAKSLSASCNNEVQYSMMLSNTGFSALNNVNLTATLPSGGGTSTATATTDLGGNSGTHDSVSVSLSSGATQAYENGSTVLYDSHGNVIKTLPDTITSSGVNVGTINGSTIEYVNFKAKVSCETPTPPTPTPTPPAKVLPNTGPGDVIGAFTGASAIGGIGHYFVSRRRR